MSVSVPEWESLLLFAVQFLCFGESSFDRTEREACLRDLEAEDRIDRALTKARFNKGRSVAKQPAMIPAPGSMVDQSDTLTAFPTIHEYRTM